MKQKDDEIKYLNEKMVIQYEEGLSTFNQLTQDINSQQGYYKEQIEGQ